MEVLMSGYLSYSHQIRSVRKIFTIRVIACVAAYEYKVRNVYGKRKTKKEKNKRTRPKILGRNIVVCIPDSKQKFRPPNACGTHPIPTLKT